MSEEGPPGVDPDVDGESGDRFAPDAKKRALLRDVADEIRGESSESKQVSAILYRVSDLYDPEEDTSPEEIYLNMRNIMNIKAQGGIRRENE